MAVMERKVFTGKKPQVFYLGSGVTCAPHRPLTLARGDVGSSLNEHVPPTRAQEPAGRLVWSETGPRTTVKTPQPQPLPHGCRCKVKVVGRSHNELREAVLYSDFIAVRHIRGWFWADGVTVLGW